MKLTKEERIAQKIALLLLSLEPNNHEPDRTYEIVANDAVGMAYRAMRSQEDPTWWEICGKPHWNERMAALKTKFTKTEAACTVREKEIEKEIFNKELKIFSSRRLHGN